MFKVEDLGAKNLQVVQYPSAIIVPDFVEVPYPIQI